MSHSEANSDGWQDVPARDGIPGYSFFTRPLERPDPDNREYRLIRLQNGLVAMLVHDAAADKAAACVDIAVGSLYDPDDVPGLAHFCEHMLSKGSTPFPAENDFLSFISSNGGTRNAGTGGSFQDYWFSIKPSLLSEALPRLAAFFHSPLFTPTLTSREIHAVDSENKRNLQNDVRRILQLGKSLSIEGHPWRKFGTGNFKSLTEAARKKFEEEGVKPDDEDDSGDGGPVGRETRRRLVEWWKQEYCAGRMSLAVIGQESVDELTDLVVPLFSKIENRGLDPRPTIKDSPWGENEMGTIVFAQTVKDYQAFSISFIIPDQRHNFATQPASLIAHFIGHEGPGSVCAYLKKKGWLIDIAAYSSGRKREVQVFYVGGKLTREGYLHYEEVVLTIFNYLNLLRSQPSPLPSYHFDEYKTMSSVSFRFREKSQPHRYAADLAYDLLEPYPPEWILSGPCLVREWDERGFREILGVMTPERGRVMVMAKYHDPAVVGEDAKWENEKWYGTEYFVRKLDQGFLDKANLPNENTELHLPEPNPYIPENLSVEKKDVAKPAKVPSRIRQNDFSALWYKKDDQFWVPKAHVKLDIRSSMAYATPRQAVLTRLLSDLLDDDLSEVTYYAELAGLGYSVNNYRGGLLVSVTGYNDKLGVLLDTVMERLKNLVIKPDRLKVMAEQLDREYKNFYIRQPSLLCDHYAACVMMPVVWTPDVKLKEIPYITVEDVQRHKDDLLSKIYFEMLVTGNIKQEDAIHIAESVEARLASARVLPPLERPQTRSLLLPTGCNLVLENDVTDPEELNSSITYYCQFGDIADGRLRPILALIVHILKEPAFSQLRTVEQLGYIVATAFWSATGSMGLGIKIQSLKSPAFLEQRIEAFLTQFRDQLSEMSEEEFEGKKDGLAIRMLEKTKNLRDEASRFWNHIRSGYYDFLQHEVDANAVRSLQLRDVLEAYNRYVSPSSRARKKMSAHVVSQQCQDVDAVELEGRTYIEDESLFKASLVCSPAAVPIRRKYSALTSMDDAASGTSNGDAGAKL
ncbi:LuxS/MPP-like metallohydrolase [Panus rudis PR-1116 ss-1]|nr:LuxS/MPP-like metallohydrolase [Panus rudis PR-1116 ss-1]